MAKVDFQNGQVLQASDLNAIGTEINALNTALTQKTYTEAQWTALTDAEKATALSQYRDIYITE